MSWQRLDQPWGWIGVILLSLSLSFNCFLFWDVPGDVLAAPESALRGWIGVLLLSLSLSSQAG